MLIQCKEGVLLKVKVFPNSSSNAVVKIENDMLIIKVTATADKNLANLSVIALLSKLLKTPKNSIEIYRGHKTRQKTLLIKNYILDQLKTKIISFLP